MRLSTWRAGAALACAALAALHPWKATGADKRAGDPPLNVLLVISDDLSTDLGCYGHPEVKTPALDRLCREGVRFDAAFCQSPLCNPSRVSLLSGLRPDKTGVYTLFTPTRERLGPSAVMLPGCFKQSGYFTVQVGKIFHTGEGFEDPQSFDAAHFEFGKSPDAGEVLRAGSPPGPTKHTIDWAVLKTPDEQTPDGIVARKAANYLEKAATTGKPFFAAVGFRRPHAPFAAPQKYFDMYPPDETSLPPPVAADYVDTLLPAALPYAWGPRPLTEREQRELRSAYFACTTFMDAQVGVLLDAMDRLGLWQNTIVVFLGDNGYHLGDHGGLWHKNSLFEESCRVPFIVYAPGAKGAGRGCARVVELLDLYPTLLDLCGMTPPHQLDGRSLAPLLDDPDAPWRHAAYSVVARAADRTKSVEEAEFLGRAVRTERWRYIEWDDGRQGVELYDRRSDPGELHNLAENPAYAEVRAELHELLTSHSAHEPLSRR